MHTIVTALLAAAAVNSRGWSPIVWNATLRTVGRAHELLCLAAGCIWTAVKRLLDRDVFIASQLVSDLSYQHTTNDKNIVLTDFLTARNSLVECEVLLLSEKRTNIADQPGAN